jgi:diguanylate cyclase (GGDEF)-like protein
MKKGKHRSTHVRHPLYLRFKEEQYGKLLKYYPWILTGEIFFFTVLLLVERVWLPSFPGVTALTFTALFILLELIFMKGKHKKEVAEGKTRWHAKLGFLHGAVGVGLSAVTAVCFSILSVDGSSRLFGQIMLLGFYLLVMGFSFLSSFPLRSWLPFLQGLPLISAAIFLGNKLGTASFAFLSLFLPFFGLGVLSFSAVLVERLYYREFRIRVLAEQRRKRVVEELKKAEQLNAELRGIRDKLEQEIKERKIMEKNLKQVAAFDELTSVYNRRAGVEVLKEALHYSVRKKSVMTVAFVDLDRLKIVNDNFGHEEGDRYIRDVVALLRKHLRKSDSLSRYGGDEFLVVLPDCTEREAAAIFNRIEEDMARVNAGDRRYPLSFSYGFAEADPYSELDYHRLIAMADDRMYLNKQKKSFEEV